MRRGVRRASCQVTASTSALHACSYQAPLPLQSGKGPGERVMLCRRRCTPGRVAGATTVKQGGDVRRRLCQRASERGRDITTCSTTRSSNTDDTFFFVVVSMFCRGAKATAGRPPPPPASTMQADTHEGTRSSVAPMVLVSLLVFLVFTDRQRDEVRRCLAAVQARKVSCVAPLLSLHLVHLSVHGYACVCFVSWSRWAGGSWRR